MTIFWQVAYLLLYLFLLFLLARLVFSYVRLLARAWRPGRYAAVLLEAVWTVTDPPIKAVRRVLPPLRLGGVSLDLGFFVVIIVVYILMIVVGGLVTP